MAWESTNVMDQRKRFVLKALDPSSSMAELCREFGIARKTGYKWVKGRLLTWRLGSGVWKAKSAGQA